MDSVRDFYRAHPIAEDRWQRTLAEAGRRIADGEDRRFAVREVLDELALRPDAAGRRATIEAEPPLVDPRTDALLAAVAEHTAIADDTPPPPWAVLPARFLERMWFVSDTPGFRAIALRESPAAFRRRGVFLAASTLHRV